MPIDEQPEPPQLPISARQQQEISDWVSKERSGGTRVDKGLIRWFASRVLRRDGDDEGRLRPDFADRFLDRHPSLARRLAAVPRPSHEERPPRKGADAGADADADAANAPPLRGMALLDEMSRRDRARALFGDAPPPPRARAPFPEGDIIYHCNDRYAVRHGRLLTKYTVSAHGWGARDHPNEAAALRFVRAHTTIPVPAVVDSAWDRVTMEYVEGRTLQQAWPVLTAAERAGILAELGGYIAQMRALRGTTTLGRLNGQGVVVPSIMTRSGGPFGSLAEMHDWLVRPPKRLEAQSMYWHQITTQLGADYPIVFTHGDIASRNIIVRDGRIVALLDWELAGWYPEYWEYVFALRGLDNLDWDTLGQHIPSLFAKRYDLEYILMNFILRLN
ncbi:putative phosphotransferase enzyme family protein [Rosellinia necatrix]|uniref:Putative phosphotransferase enzyme family protein n=1 Tax=Rosellinia necatrix TaxID=77044 RepID=A0A1W2TTM6_ROSNE|nr:putative phosphotransferase enzyme family protein [Rosellinia necatrix]